MAHEHHQHEHEEQEHHDHDGHDGHDHGGHDHGAMVDDFKKRFYISLIITLPILLWRLAFSYRSHRRREEQKSRHDDADRSCHRRCVCI
ncbi:hypothetical protein SAMN04488054_13613 [Salibacterium qingdaonense]|uniref:Uncharacterized protein n=1 Tax=Salibacterium qingdaonense TaxID=266892 RepID=A0A1I4Q345_9BACI|nr:hypothetical protein SAMN04488054_13613 [Salibacterium qingdaonense]